MPGTSSFDPPPLPLATIPIPILVFRWSTEGEYTYLPNVLCVSIDLKVGPNAGHAVFRYVFDDSGVWNQNGDWPTRPEEIIGYQATDSEYIAQVDDRLVVMGVTAKGKYRILFDGFTQPISARFAGHAGAVEFVALATPIREFDDPLWPTMYRDADDYDVETANKLVHLEARFNPDGLPNATEDGDSVVADAGDHPIFLDVDTCDIQGIGRSWTVAMAARYILARGNPERLYVTLPDFDAMDTTLDNWSPDGEFYDPEDPSTWTAHPIECQDLDVTGLQWPIALEKLLSPHGFGFYFQLRGKEVSGQDLPEPEWFLKVFRLDDSPPQRLKTVGLQDPGSILDPAQTSLAQMALTRDVTDIANAIRVETRRARYEVCVVLAPGFQPASADAADANAMRPFQRGDGTAPQSATNVEKYRLYVYDETGSGHWDYGSATWLTTAVSLAPILGGQDAEEDWYVRRRRPGKKTLLSRDASGNPRQATLELSTNYTGKAPGPWDGSGTWFPIPNGWSLYRHGLGITVDIANPESWDSGNKSINFGVNAKSAAGVIRGISAQAKSGETRFFLKLTCVIEGDLCSEALADRRDASPTGYTLTSIIDGRERYHLDVIDFTSPFNSTGKDILDRDDTDAATYEAEQRRAAHESPPLAGPIVIRRLTNSYGLGDRITEVSGRNLSLQTNRGSEGGEGPRFPMVVGLRYEFGQAQKTTLMLSDERKEGPTA